MSGLFGSLVSLVDDVVTIATAPVKLAVDVTRLITEPVADTMSDVANAVSDDDMTEP